jgi:hypothetical protein
MGWEFGRNGHHADLARNVPLVHCTAYLRYGKWAELGSGKQGEKPKSNLHFTKNGVQVSCTRSKCLFFFFFFCLAVFSSMLSSGHALSCACIPLAGVQLAVKLELIRIDAFLLGSCPPFTFF